MQVNYIDVEYIILYRYNNNFMNSNVMIIYTYYFFLFENEQEISSERYSDEKYI